MLFLKTFRRLSTIVTVLLMMLSIIIIILLRNTSAAQRRRFIIAGRRARAAGFPFELANSSHSSRLPASSPSFSGQMMPPPVSYCRGLEACRHSMIFVAADCAT